RDLLPLPTPLPARAARAVASVADAAWEDVKAFAVEHGDEIQLAADVLAVAGTGALALSVVCPPLAVVAAGTRLAGAAASLAGAAGGGASVGITVLSAGANAAVVAGDEEKTVRDLWPDLLAVGTLGASRALTASGRLVPGRFPLTVPQARAADAGLPARSGVTRPSTWPSRGDSPRELPSIWDPATGIGPNELVVRSVRFAVETPNAVVGTAGGVAAGRRLRGRWAGGRPIPGRGASARSGTGRARDPQRKPA
ncbi:MAG: hypothetical protein M3P95_13750, partial [Actinomycetota bacterium]|nr:hypothetical protein [Actinomycetota bacterium]